MLTMLTMSNVTDYLMGMRIHDWPLADQESESIPSCWAGLFPIEDFVHHTIRPRA